MAEFSELVQALTWLLTNRIQQKIEYTHGLLGDGNGRVRVSTIPGSPEVDYVFVRPDRFSNRSFKVFNKRVEGQDGDPIIIGELPWEPGLVQVVDMDWAAYADVGWGDDVTTTNRHGSSHQWRDGAPGIDTFNVYRRQFGDLKTYATVSGTLNVGVSPYSLDLFGTQYQWPGIQDFSLAGALPTATGTARMALVFWSPASGTTRGFLGVATGTLGSGAEATILNRPVSPQGVIPSAFVRLAGGQSSITEFDIWDAREPFRPGLSFSTGTAGLSADMIPISDVVGFYTGSTIEAALAEVPYKLIAPDGGINPVLSADNAGDVTLAGTGDLIVPDRIIHSGDTPTFIQFDTGAIGISTPGPDAKLDILDTAGSQLRLTFEDGVKFADFEVDTNHDLTIKTSSTGGFRYQPTTDQTDSFQVLDAGGGIPAFNVDLVNERVGIGTATIPHGGVGAAKLAIDGADSSAANGPHLQFTTDNDDHPLFQMFGFAHDNMSINFDAYFDGANWKSSDAGSNFQFIKFQDSISFNYESGVAQGGNITWSGGIVLNIDGGVGFNTSTIPHAGVGAAKFAIDGTDANILGPHIQITTGNNNHPVFQMLNWAHDNISHNFDAYFDGIWKSGDAGSNFQMIKFSDEFSINYDSGVALGTLITWNTGILLNTLGNVGIGTASPQGQLHTYESISGFIVWEFDGLDATIRTIIPNGTGDVLYRLTAMFVLRDSAAAVASGTTDVSNAASVNLTVGGNTVRLRVNADGSTDIARTAGTDTIKVALVLRWL